MATALRHRRALEPLLQTGVALREFKMAHNRDIGFFSVIAASVLAAALLVALLIGGEISGPKVAFISSPPITAH